ncbi:MAG: 3-phosphoshikimate 1-carboxyvinyltransferase [Gemmatimonadota bacterium]
MTIPAVTARVPGDKSITHRALLFAALAAGPSRLTGHLDSADTRSTAAALRALGVAVTDLGRREVTVVGRGADGLRSPGERIDCGNSGTTARLLLGLLAGSPVEATLDGDASLRGRPMRRVTGPLGAAGAHFEELGEAGRLPIRVHGGPPLAPIDLDNVRSSAQVKTAMLLAGLTGGAPVVVREPGRSRDLSERMLRAMGVGVVSERAADGAYVTRLDPGDRPRPLDLAVPGDISSAAFFLGYGALAGPVEVHGVGLNPTRTGALDVLERMGADVRVDREGAVAGEPVGRVRVGPGRTLRGTVVAAGEVPTLLDEIPLLAAVAARAEGETRFEGVAELRVKESDRIDAVVTNLARLGVEARAGTDQRVVRGRPGSLEGTAVSRGDHRIAMAFAVLGAVPGNAIRVHGMSDVEISFPTFAGELERVKRELEAR